MPLERATVHVEDRGFQFADAVYEVVRTYNGRPFAVEDHLSRLFRSLAAVEIRTEFSAEQFSALIHEAVQRAGFPDAMVYLQITRGVAPRKHPFPADTVPTEFLYVQEFTDPYANRRQEGVAVLTQPDLRWGRCDIKSTNLLGNVMAMQAAAEAGCVEALLYLPDGTLTEATHSSSFAVKPNP